MPELAERPTKKTPRLRDAPSADFSSVVLKFRPTTRLSDDELFRFCQDNHELRIEQTAQGNLIIMAPVGTEGGYRNFNLYKDFVLWHERTGEGKFFDATAGFRLPNGAMRSPDLAWVRQEKLDPLTQKQWEQFAPVCPDFVVELRSQSDRLSVLKQKLVEYLENGARLGWLIDPLQKQVFIYRPGQPVEHLKAPQTLSGEPVLAGFTLDLTRVW